VKPILAADLPKGHIVDNLVDAGYVRLTTEEDR
jgi:hypothetical protein